MEKLRSPKKQLKSAKKGETGALGPASWIAAAWEALEHRGVEGVRVEPLAAQLGVTKGSFYWHFADRAALLDALLEDWEKRATASVIEQVDAASEQPQERLRKLVSLTTASSRAPNAEQAIRAWGAHDLKVRRRLHRVDARREAYVASLLVDAGVCPELAAMRSRVLYLTLIGEYTRVAHGGAPTERAVWDRLVAMMLEIPRAVGRG